MYKNNKKGFSVIEILAVIVILGLLIAIAIPAVNKQLNNFRYNYYKKLEESIKSAGQDYVSDKRFAKPTKLLYSRIIKVEELEDENYIDEVKDYLGNYCDSTETSYSYVVAVKTGEKKYDYQTCLKCSADEYVTDTSGEKNDYCNPAWLDTEDVEYEYSYDDSFMYVYYGTSEEEIEYQVGLTYDVVKRDEKGNILAKVISSGDESDIVYPQNINELVGANLNSVITLKYLIPNGETVTKQAVIYKHNAPQVVATYAADNVVTGKKTGDSYGGAFEWASKLQLKISFSNRDLEKVLENVKIKSAEYYDEVSKKWIDTGCTVTDNTTCVWTIDEDFDKNVKIRVVNEDNNKGDPSLEYILNVDKTKPSCVSNNGNTTWAKNKTVNVVCGDALSGCSQGTFGVTYPTATVKNKKTDNITIYDKAGNSNSCAVNIYVDSTPPSSCSITMKNSIGTTLSNGATSTSDVTFSVSGVDSAVDDSGIKTNTWVVTQGSNRYNNLSSTNDKNNGTYSVVATCTDNAGNTTTSNASVVLDKSITITFNKNNGTGTMSTLTCKYNQACTLTPNAFSRTGYTFIGWNTKADGSGTSYSNGGSITTKNSITLYAQWKIKTFNLTYDCNGGSGCPQDQSKVYGVPLALTNSGNAPTRSGYEFLGWGITNSTHTISYNRGSNYTNDESITLYAIWRKELPFTFVVNGASLSATSSSCYIYNAEKNCDLTLPTITRSGFTIYGFASSSSASSQASGWISGATVNVNKDTALTWYAITSKSKSFTFYENGATISKTSASCTIWNSATTCSITLPTITRSGFAIYGFASSSSASSQVSGWISGATVNVNKDTTLTWYAITSKGVTVTFNGNGATISKASDSCTIWNSATTCSIKSPTITRSGFTKVGFATSASSTSSSWSENTDKTFSSDATYYAITSKNITITFNKNGATEISKSSDSCTIWNSATTCSIKSPTITAPYNTPTLVGFNTSSTATTSQWSHGTDKDVSSNATYYAITKKSGYTLYVYYDGNGGTGSTSNSSCTISDAYNGAAQGSSCSLSLRANGFSKTSYSFNGWSTSSSASSGSVAGTTVAISSDTTYYATWKQDVTLKTVCETYSSDDLFGTRKGAIDGNYGTWHSSLDYTYTCSTAVGKCSRSNGYERICVTDACGPYKGKTASWMKDNEPSCSKLSRLWCSCSDTGEF